MNIDGTPFRAIWVDETDHWSVRIIDQTRLPWGAGHAAVDDDGGGRACHKSDAGARRATDRRRRFPMASRSRCARMPAIQISRMPSRCWGPRAPPRSICAGGWRGWKDILKPLSQAARPQAAYQAAAANLR